VVYVRDDAEVADESLVHARAIVAEAGGWVWAGARSRFWALGSAPAR
jgi:hypothetical protein